MVLGAEQFRHVTMPLISHVTFFNLVLGIIGALQVFTDAYVITNGGPNNATMFISVYLYRHAFIYLNFGYSAALAWVLFMIVLVLTLLVFRSSPIWVFYRVRTTGEVIMHTPVRWFRRRSSQQLLMAIGAAVLLLGGAAVIMVPFLWMISTSLKQAGEVYVMPQSGCPIITQWVNFVTAWTRLNFSLYASNTFLIVSTVMVGTLFSASFAAYGFARLRAPGRDFIFMLLLATLMLPGAVTLVPTYLMFNKIGWVNTFLPLIVPAFFGNAFYVFLMRQFYITIPRELEESAMMDGATIYQIWWYIMLPL
jgi:ABC-type glycerol-3-phosphate transport system permease component